MAKVDRLGEALEATSRISADRTEERAGCLKPKNITVNFNDTELYRLRGRAYPAGMKLQDYILKI
jgi:hypothetical protein